MRRIFFAGIAALMTSGIWAWAQTDKPIKTDTARFGNPTSTVRELQNLLYGVIKSLDKNEMVLEKTKFGIDQTVKLNAKTKFIHDGEPATNENLKVGEQVWLKVKMEKKTRDMIAERVYTGVLAPTIRK